MYRFEDFEAMTHTEFHHFRMCVATCIRSLMIGRAADDEDYITDDYINTWGLESKETIEKSKFYAASQLGIYLYELGNFHRFAQYRVPREPPWFEDETVAEADQQVAAARWLEWVICRYGRSRPAVMAIHACVRKQQITWSEFEIFEYVEEIRACLDMLPEHDVADSLEKGLIELLGEECYYAG